VRIREILVTGACLLLPSCKDDAPPVTADTGTTSATAATAATAATSATAADGSTAPAATSSPASSDSADTTAGTETCNTSSAAALVQCVDRDAIAQDVAFIADIRTPGTPHWLAVQELCIDRLTMLGFTVELHEYASGTNVIGRLPGTGSPDEVVLVGAHYDHIAECLGADDNATGVAGALEAARVLATADARPRTLAVACWDEEELGLVGSEAWVASGQATGETVVAYFNYDMIGYINDEPDSQTTPMGFDAVFPEQYGQVQANEFRGDFILMVADDLALAPAAAYEAHAATLELPAITVVLDAFSKNSELFNDLRRSDHASFWQVDIPAMFFTDTANFRNAAYHCLGGEDTVDSLDFEFNAKVVAATVGAAAETLGVAP
jgi:Peptidase family M28